MNVMTLTIVLNMEMDKVLMCYHNKQRMHNFIGGHVNEGEPGMDASYRELLEETGITSDDVDLQFVRLEKASSPLYDPYELFITCGVLKNRVKLHQEKNILNWVYIKDVDLISDQTFGMGNCLVYLREAVTILGMEHLLPILAVGPRPD